MDKSSALKLCAAFAFSAVASGCSEHVVLEIFNDTPTSLALSGCCASVPVAPGSIAEIDPVTCGGEIRLEGVAGSWRYRVPIPDHGVYPSGAFYFHRRGTLFWQDALVLLQINTDHTLWALPDGTGFPLRGKITQPYGFPVEPR